MRAWFTAAQDSVMPSWIAPKASEALYEALAGPGRASLWGDPMAAGSEELPLVVVGAERLSECWDGGCQMPR